MEAGRFGDCETPIGTQVATEEARIKGRNSQERREEENRLDTHRPSHGSCPSSVRNAMGMEWRKATVASPQVPDTLQLLPGRRHSRNIRPWRLRNAGSRFDRPNRWCLNIPKRFDRCGLLGHARAHELSEML